MRDRPARVRHALWLVASIKFLVPFAALIWIGSHLGIPVPSHGANSSGSGLVFAVERGGPDRVSASHARGAIDPRIPPRIWFVLWVCGFAAVGFAWGREYRRLRRAVRAGRSVPLVAPIRAVCIPGRFEPGVFGILRPVLLLPEGILERLTPAELNAIVAHEMWHVRRRDNLIAALHTLVEAVFWFNPVVWWVERRLIEERELACDEAVLAAGNAPHDYAEGILKVCEHYLSAPSMCVAGVSGPDLKQRIARISVARTASALGVTRRIALVLAGATSIITPVAIGVINAPRLTAQSPVRKQLSFEVASIKVNSGEDRRLGLEFQPGGRVIAHGLPLYMLVAMAYDIPFQSARLVGGPDWARAERYDIEAKADPAALEGAVTVKERNERMRAMIQTLLKDRFRLVLRVEPKEVPVYELVPGRRGTKLEKSKVEEKDCGETSTDSSADCHNFHGGMGRGLHAVAASLTDLAQFVSNWTDKPVIDRTHIAGLYKFESEGWAPMRPRQPGSDDGPEAQQLADPTRPTLEMILDRFGLRIAATKAVLDMYVIERAEKPAEN
jgi:uncharacterized protein (TIGR03435 family)